MDPKESKLRALYRLVCLLLLPGLSDHFPVRPALGFGLDKSLGVYGFPVFGERFA